jgi:dodecin
MSSASARNRGKTLVDATSKRPLARYVVAEVAKMDMKVEDGKVTAFRTRVALSFKYEA